MTALIEEVHEDIDEIVLTHLAGDGIVERLVVLKP